MRLGSSMTEKGSGQKRNSNRKYFGLWYEIHDYESAKTAANLARFSAGGIAGLYILILFLNPPSSEYLFQTESFEMLFAQWGRILPLPIAVWLIFRLHQGKYGVVPWIAAWSLFEGVNYSLMFQPGALLKVFLILVVVSFSINSWRGWRGLKKFGDAPD